MTPEETIKIAIHCFGVQAEQEVCEECPVYLESGIACREVARVAISALKEIQQYREIGTVEECREAVDKQNYMKIKTIEDMCFECPKCKELVAHDDGWNTYNYCPNCGQKLEWEESEEE